MTATVFFLSFISAPHTETSSGQKRRRRYLAVELAPPSPRDCRAAVGTGTVGGQTIVLDEIAVPLDEHRATLVAPCVLELADTPGQIARVHVAQAVTPADLRGFHQHLRGGVLGIVHPVVLVERGHMPWQ